MRHQIGIMVMALLVFFSGMVFAQEASFSAIAWGDASINATSSNCSYNDCALNQVACASAFAYNLCVGPDASGCNRWEPTLCEGNDRCYSNTPQELEKCMGIGPGKKPGHIEAEGGVYFYYADTPTNPNSNPNPTQNNPTTIPANNLANTQNLNINVNQIARIGDGRYNVIDVSTETTYGVIVSGGNVTSVQQGAISPINATIRVKPEALTALQSASDPIVEVRRQLDNGGIEYIPSGVIDQIKFFFIRLFLNFR